MKGVWSHQLKLAMKDVRCFHLWSKFIVNHCEPSATMTWNLPIKIYQKRLAQPVHLVVVPESPGSWWLMQTQGNACKCESVPIRIMLNMMKQGPKKHELLVWFISCAIKFGTNSTHTKTTGSKTDLRNKPKIGHWALWRWHKKFACEDQSGDSVFAWKSLKVRVVLDSIQVSSTKPV